jgi:DNA polymerase-3 subunit delta
VTGPAGEPAVWLVQGGDPILVADATRELVNRLLGGQDPTLALEDAGAEADLAAVADACRTPPFLGDRRVVVVGDLGERPAEAFAPLVDYLADPMPTTSLVLVAGDDKLPAKLLAAVKASGRVVAAAGPGRDAVGWVHQRTAQSAVRLDRDAEARLTQHLGEDVSRLGALLDVLAAAYGEGARVDSEMLEPYLGEAGGVAPWDLTDAIDAGDAQTALTVLHRMLGAGGRHPLVVLAGLHRHVASMLKVEDPCIHDERDAARLLGIAEGRSTFPAKKALAGARRLGPDGTAEAVGLVADAEVALKGGLEWPPELVLEVLVARLCRLSRAAGGSRRR